MYFVAYLFKEGLLAGTVKSYLAAVRHSHADCLGVGESTYQRDAEMPRLEYIYIVKGLNIHDMTQDRAHIGRFVKDVWLQAAGIDLEKYSGHSFRIGAASTAARYRLQDSLIKTLGRWESMAYTLYIRTPREMLCTVSCVLVGG